MRLTTVVGARPQFIKVAAITRVLRASYALTIEHILVHTGQHHDDNMSRIFFDQLGLPAADVNLGIAGGAHGQMTGRMLEALENVFVEKRPDCVLVFGDTNSTLAAALASVKLHIPVAHVEAGLRSYNRAMPEEINRVVTDHVSTHLFCPTKVAADNLKVEGISRRVHLVGDVMFDTVRHYGPLAEAHSVLDSAGLTRGAYYLATCHRAENTDDPNRLKRIAEAFAQISKRHPVALPLHPRTKKRMEELGASWAGDIKILPPLGYLEMLDLERHAAAILTDSGGVQKEAFLCGVPCITLRTETEWTETVESGWNVITDTAPERIVAAVEDAPRVRMRHRPALYGDGNAAELTIRLIVDAVSGGPS